MECKQEDAFSAATARGGYAEEAGREAATRLRQRIRPG